MNDDDLLAATAAAAPTSGAGLVAGVVLNSPTVGRREDDVRDGFAEGGLKAERGRFGGRGSEQRRFGGEAPEFFKGASEHEGRTLKGNKAQGSIEQ